MAWPEWMARAYVKKLYRPVTRRFGEVELAVAGPCPRVGLVTSCGVHRRDDRPFDVSTSRGDPSFRTVSIDDPPARWMVTHGHYEPAGVLADYGICLPIAALREAQEEGLIEGIHPEAYSYVGYGQDLDGFVDEHLPPVAEAMRKDRVTAVLLTPC